MIYLFVIKNWWIRDKLLAYWHQISTKENDVNDIEKIDEILKSFEIIPYDKLPKDYLETTKSDILKYKNILKDLKYYKIKRSDINRKIVRDIPLKKFICKDYFYKRCVRNDTQELICLLNPRILYKTLLLVQTMEKKQYNYRQIAIINGHRHPKYNEKVGGAQLSRHIKGEAVDIVVGDINNDGNINKRDKEIILGLLENEIIKDEGGIGIYPGTRNLHYDVRGYKARWNTY